MDIVKRDQFIALWRKYFNDAELPVAFYYSKENNNATIVKKAPIQWIKLFSLAC